MSLNTLEFSDEKYVFQIPSDLNEVQNAVTSKLLEWGVKNIAQVFSSFPMASLVGKIMSIDLEKKVLRIGNSEIPLHMSESGKFMAQVAQSVINAITPVNAVTQVGNGRSKAANDERFQKRA